MPSYVIAVEILDVPEHVRIVNGQSLAHWARFLFRNLYMPTVRPAIPVGQALAVDGAKMRFFHTMLAGKRSVATSEHFMLHVSLETRRPVPPLSPLAEGMARFGAAALDWPEGAGRAVGQRR